MLARHAVRDAGAPAIVTAGLGTLSFGVLVRHVRQIGTQLAAAGIGPSSRVGIALQRGPEAALLNVAISANATVLPINPNLPPAELREELKRIRLHALGRSGRGPASRHGSTKTRTGVVLFKASKAASSFEEIALAPVKDVRRPAPPSRVTEQSWAAIFRTSGTTGPSKRVPVTHENLIEMARKMERWLALTPADRSACIMPIYYNAGFKATLVAPLLVGCSVALPESTGAHDIEQWLGELRPTWLTASPAFLQAVVEKLSALVRSDPSLSPCASSCRRPRIFPIAPASSSTRLLGKPVVEFYGLCEAGMMTGAGAVAGKAGLGRPHPRGRACNP